MTRLPASIASAPWSRPRARRREPPGPSGHRLLGSLHDVRTDRLRFVTTATRDYGDLVGFRMGPKRLYLLRHPDHIRHVLTDNVQNYHKGLGLDEARPLLGDGLLTSEGALWASQRRLVQTALQQHRMDRHAVAIAAAVNGVADRWAGFAARGEVVDVAREMTRLAMQVVADCMLTPRLIEVADDCARDLAEIGRWSMRRMSALVKLPLAVPTPGNVRARRALGRLDRHAAALIDESRARRPFVTDLIARLEAGAGAPTAPGVAPRLVRDEIMTLLLAGHETTASLLAWIWHLLARHPDAADRLRQELDTQLAGRSPGLDDVPRLRYTRMVVNEGLRLYPPVWLLPRRSLAADDIGGYDIPAGSDVLISIYSLHRHPAFWPDPDRFDPERFAPPPGADPHARMPAFLPFGAGPRTCVGMRLGLVEAMLAIASLAQRFTLSCADDRVPIPEASLSLHPRGGVPMIVRERTGGSS
jgi:cytochrome P450